MVRQPGTELVSDYLKAFDPSPAIVNSESINMAPRDLMFLPTELYLRIFELLGCGSRSARQISRTSRYFEELYDRLLRANMKNIRRNLVGEQKDGICNTTARERRLRSELRGMEMWIWIRVFQRTRRLR